MGYAGNQEPNFVIPTCIADRKNKVIYNFRNILGWENTYLDSSTVLLPKKETLGRLNTISELK